MIEKDDKNYLEKIIFTDEQLARIYKFRSKNRPNSISRRFEKVIEEQEEIFLLSYLHLALIENGVLSRFLSGDITHHIDYVSKLLRRYWSQIKGQNNNFFCAVLIEARKWRLGQLENLIASALRINDDNPKYINSMHLYFETCVDIRAYNERFYFDKLLTFGKSTSYLQDTIPIFIFNTYGSGKRSVPSLYVFLQTVALTKLGYLANGEGNRQAQLFIRNQEQTPEGKIYIEQISDLFFGKGLLVQRLISDEDARSCLCRYIPNALIYNLFWHEGLLRSESFTEDLQKKYTDLERESQVQNPGLMSIAIQHLMTDRAKSLFFAHWDKNQTSFSLMRNRVAICNIMSLLFDLGRIETQHISLAFTRGLGYDDFHLHWKRKEAKSLVKISKKTAQKPSEFKPSSTVASLQKMMAQAKNTAIEDLYYQFIELSREDQKRFLEKIDGEFSALD